jgi:acyl-CoA thioester hydrolase
LGIKASYLEDAEPAAWALRKVKIEYIHPAKMDDVIEVRTTVAALSGARMAADQAIWRGDELLTRGTVEACIISLSGRPKRIPPEIRDKILPFLSETVA